MTFVIACVVCFCFLNIFSIIYVIVIFSIIYVIVKNTPKPHNLGQLFCFDTQAKLIFLWIFILLYIYFIIYLLYLYAFYLFLLFVLFVVFFVLFYVWFKRDYTKQLKLQK